MSGELPARLGRYTTQVTWALDVAVVLPAVVISAWLCHCGDAQGWLYGGPCSRSKVALGVGLIGQGAAQLVVGVPVTAAEIVGATASFAVMTAVAPTARCAPPTRRTMMPDGGAETDTPGRAPRRMDMSTFLARPDRRVAGGPGGGEARC